MKTIDTNGHLCPKPLILTKKALKDLETGSTFKVLTDNATAKDNLMSFLTDFGTSPTCEEKNGEYTILGTVPMAPDDQIEAESYCKVESNTPPRPHIICFKSDKMGEGDPDLGDLLIKAFINTIKEVQPLPETLVFYNKGIVLASEEADTFPALKELEEMGIRIICCGTCADFYHIKDKIKVGMISNMYHILETLTNAGHIIFP